MRELSGAVVVVVGATGALGAALCDELLDQRAVVLGAGRRGPDIEMDLRDARSGDAVVRAALGTQGRLDGVVNVAQLVAAGGLLDTDDVTIEELFLTNALGPLWLVRRVLPALAQHGGFFAAVSGAAAEASTAGDVPFGASVAALSHALAALRNEAGARGVHVLDLRPGTTPPEAVARRIVTAILADEHEVPAASFVASS